MGSRLFAVGHQQNWLCKEKERKKSRTAAGASVIHLEWEGTGVFLLTCAQSAQEGQQGHLSWSRGVNSEETNRHLSGLIDFHMKSKYIHSVCAASQFFLPVGRAQSLSLPFDIMFLWLSLYRTVWLNIEPDNLLLLGVTGWEEEQTWRTSFLVSHC